ncbi:hypothetical protein C0Q70_05625 [Pomacea canaliculata]|uniref:Uncharacterized protein n=2 Tax=Pomacea canaliculata TaxID=400727 RepID=A0A2T7PLS5_POMCA|nr:hypothetical protein C0Q70_05625 [Pomacea canaliculata]
MLSSDTGDVVGGSVREVRDPTQLQKTPHHTSPYLDTGRCSVPFSALPTDTLESILGQADLSELLSGRWQQGRDSNHTPCDGSVGTSSPRSFSDSSDAYCTSSPRPSSTQSRSPSWSPCLPAGSLGSSFGTYMTPSLEEGVTGRHLDPGGGYFLQQQQHHQQHHSMQPHHHQQPERLSHVAQLQPERHPADQPLLHQPQQTLQTLPSQPVQHQQRHQQKQQQQEHYKLSSQDANIPADLIFRGDFVTPTTAYFHELPQQPHQHLQQQHQGFAETHELLTFPQIFPSGESGQGYNNGDFGSWQSLQPDSFFPYMS